MELQLIYYFIIYILAGLMVFHKTMKEKEVQNYFRDFPIITTGVLFFFILIWPVFIVDRFLFPKPKK